MNASSIVRDQVYFYKQLSKKCWPFSKKRRFYETIAQGLLEISRQPDDTIANSFGAYLARISECEAIENYDNPPIVTEITAHLQKLGNSDDKIAIDAGFKL